LTEVTLDVRKKLLTVCFLCSKAETHSQMEQSNFGRSS